jgi:hypothetical protein
MHQNKIGILVLGQDNFWFYENILKCLPKSHYEVLIWDHEKDYHNIERGIQACVDRGITYRIVSEAQAQGIYYKYILSHLPFGDSELKTLRRLGEIQIRYLYGLGFDGYQFAEWNKYYDVILCYGPYQCHKLAFCKDALKVQIGYPRYDTFFNSTPNRGTLLTRLRCDPSRKTIVWLPTMGQLCSIEYFAASIASLSASYNVIVKPHCSTLDSKPELVALLNSLPFTNFLTSPFDSLDLFRISDFVIADYGGSAFGALYTDRNIILLDVPGAEHHEHMTPDSSDNVLRSRIRSFKPGITSIDIQQLLADKVYWEEQSQLRKQFRDYFFAPYYGSSSNVAAAILSGLDALTSNSMEVINPIVDGNLRAISLLQ